LPYQDTWAIAPLVLYPLRPRQQSILRCRNSSGRANCAACDDGLYWAAAGRWCRGSPGLTGA
jgi:hypothetical protein